MKTALVLQQFKKCIILFMAGLLCSTLAYIIYVVDPVTRIVDANLIMAPDSTVYSMWKKPPIDVYIKVYIFNITNPDEFLDGGVPLKIDEVGPYVYKEVLEHFNVTWHDNGTMSYYPRRTISFVRELSVGDPNNDLVRVPNIPFLGVASALSDAGFLINYPLARLTGMLDTKSILNISVHEYLWGYEDSLVSIASGIVPNFINFKKFGLLDRMYDEGENKVFMNVKKKEDMVEEVGRYLSIDTYNGMTGLPQWGYREPEGNETYPENTLCNRIRGATEGTIFPPRIDKKAKFRVYRKSFCRPIPIVFKKEVQTEDGLNGYLYSTPDDFLAPGTENPENACYCRNPKKCPKRGLTDMTPCYYNIPAAMSLPHFLNGDPSLAWNVEGLKPEPERHEARIVLQPVLGIPMVVNSRVQINLLMRQSTYYPKVTPFNNMTVPLFWTDLHIPGLTDQITLYLKMSLQVGPMLSTAVVCLLGLAGATCVLLSVYTAVWLINQQQPHERRDSADLRIPLSNGHYTTIHVLQKITSKTDLFT